MRKMLARVPWRPWQSQQEQGLLVVRSCCSAKKKMAWNLEARASNEGLRRGNVSIKHMVQKLLCLVNSTAQPAASTNRATLLLTRPPDFRHMAGLRGYSHIFPTSLVRRAATDAQSRSPIRTSYFIIPTGVGDHLQGCDRSGTNQLADMSGGVLTANR